MKKAILLSGFLLIITLTSKAQEKVGFSNPDNIDPLLEYRLPDWGYSNFTLDFFLNNDSRNRITSEDQKDRRQNFDFEIQPGYTLYRESEKRIFNLVSSFSLGYSYIRNEENPEGDVRKQNYFDNNIYLDASLREYISPEIFLLIDGYGRFEYGFNSFENGEEGVANPEEKSIDRILTSSTRIGIGFGRVRNVNPVIRALRLSERYGVIENQPGFSDHEIRSAAEVFTKFNGYQNRYDRPEKYFWQAMDQAVNGAISDLEPFDLFYLSDVLNENIGSRLEGWDIAAGGEFDYMNVLDRDEDSLDPSTPDLQRSFFISKSAGVFLQGRWYKNISLRHQIGFNGNINRSYPTGTNSVVKWNMNTAAQISWLWNLTDRFLLNTRLQNQYSASEIDTDYFNDGRSWIYTIIVNTNLAYFIENSFALTTRLQYNLTYSGDSGGEAVFSSRTSSFGINVGFSYYFRRHLY